MAKETITRVTCDGCDVEQGEAKFAHVVVGIGPPDNLEADHEFDLCPPCKAKLHELADPLRWERKVRRKRKASA